ncbi:MAG TPA: zinc-ribbon domain-containing protein [Glaciihabitans sp.]|jgi:hypothetical protein|nr:zinc-ribbon domain-containing protein [Glaciihabitans sp.]
MFLLFGTRRRDSIINVVAFTCHFCGVHAQQQVVKLRSQFTLFFLPLFSYSTSYLNQCTNCGGQTPLTADQAQHSLAWAAQQK